MIDWLKNITKEHPEFWKNYQSKFDNKSNRYVALSIETTGLNPSQDVILSIGAIALLNDTIYIGESFEVILMQNQYLNENKNANDFLLVSNQPKVAENKAIEEFINFIGNATLIGHRIHFDIEMINESLEKLSCGRLKNEALDVEVMYKKLHDINDKNFSLNELTQIFKIEKNERLSTIDDAYTIALLFLKLKNRLGIK